ncbi:hypothetical protein H8M03_12595 [Sphingomonas sabuli]|uniref:Uncharacterized protein n=1 Tax=Sphingomonas sabuli TaxID=2764186 RepID=A0A7G9L2F1_9SPHN|nr:hypothetical protein [Sphingomonas sabuli]QNM82800.1 hypothetical protein H8M03_12595 [Sphingomonas sabuli]
MAGYRIYRIDMSGRVLSAEWVESDDDDAALSHARDHYIDAEVWQGDRLVGRTGASHS